MKSSVRRRVGVTVWSGIIAGVLMVLLGMEPRLVLLGCVVMVVSATTWLLIDTEVATAPIVWHRHGAGADTSAPSDRRVKMLRARLRQPAHRRRVTTADDVDADEIADTLVAVIDDHLKADHGLDRSTDPAAAATVLGPDLARFVNDPAARRSMTRRRSLARTLALIEDL